MISFALSTSDDSGSQWISTFPVQVCAPQVNAESLIVDDSGGVDPNGMLDPGETANLIAVLENSGCAGLTDLNLSITTTSPYLTIVDGVASLPELPPETTITNESDPFVVEASPSTPYGEEISILLNVTASGGFDESYSLLLIVGRGGNFLVWDPDQNHNSGTLIRDILDSLGYRGFYWDGSDLGEYRDILDNFQSVFVCVGVYPNNHVIQSGSADAQALSDYLTNGGKMYLEGGDVWYYDPLYQGGYNFAPLFGLNAYADGSGDMGTLEGLSGTFTEGMSFPYGGENNWMDHIQQQASGSFNIFRNLSPFYYCGVAYDNGTRRTVGTSFELGGLNDGPPPSTKAALLDSIMHFFGIYQNLPPNGFSLIEPQDGDTTSLPLLLDWEDAEDPNPGDVVVYDLYISLSENFSPESTIIYADLSESQYTLTSLPEIAKGKLPFKKKSQLRQNMGIPGVDPVSSSRTDGSKREISGGSPGIAQEDEYNFYHWKVLARDNYGGETWSNQTWTFLLPACQMGDANGDGSVDMNDLTFLANYIFQSGPEPTPCADMNGDGIIDGNDLTMLANYLFGREGKSNTPGMKKKDIQGKVTN